MKLISFFLTFICFTMAMAFLSHPKRRLEEKNKLKSKSKKCAQACKDRRKRNKENKAKEDAARFNQNVWDNNTINSCYSFSIGSYYDNWAYLWCKNARGYETGQKVHLVKIIGNNEGKMVRGSDYYNSCKSFSMSSNGVLSGKCKNGQGKYFDTSIDLKTILVYKNDALSY